ncbi:hypothetical protein ABEB36_009276 [Hypothenemus hampei]|uniref:CCR4-NOT transcription complex subunit 11 n=1 Tax=Hypothenemus hampei TaxID=57062 RepID=A0ABD1EFV9_HYPHA
MALTANQCNLLLDIFEPENIKSKTLEVISNDLNKKFQKTDHLKVGNCLVMLLQQNLLQEKDQRLAAITVLYELYRSEPLISNPFGSVFVQLLYPPEQHNTVGAPKLEYPGQLPKLTEAEKHFLCLLLSDVHRDSLLRRTGSQITNLDISPKSKSDFSALRLSLAEKLIELPHTSKSGIPVILSLPDKNQQKSTEEVYIRDIVNKLAAGENAPINKVYKPELVTLAPPLLNCQDELVWLNATNPKEHLVCYDATMCIPDIAGYEVRQLMNKAYKAALSLPQQQQLLGELEKDPKLVYHIGLTPQKLPELVENNPLIAIEVLLKLMQSKQITEYFSILVNMEMSLHSMEVVNRICASVYFQLHIHL